MLKMSASGSAVVLEDRQRGGDVVAKATRRRVTAEYKLRVLREADACTEPGEIGVLLRREGWYTSYLCLWRKQGCARELMGLAPARRGPAPKVAALEQETRWLNARAEGAEALVELQKKSQRFWGSHCNGTERRTDGGVSRVISWLCLLPRIALGKSVDDRVLSQSMTLMSAPAQWEINQPHS